MWAAAQLLLPTHPPLKLLVWCPPSLLLSGPQAQSTHVYKRVHVCTHICVNMILWSAESSRKFFCSEVILATPGQVPIWATQQPISWGLVLLVEEKHPLDQYRSQNLTR